MIDLPPFLEAFRLASLGRANISAWIPLLGNGGNDELSSEVKLLSSLVSVVVSMLLIIVRGVGMLEVRSKIK